MLIYETYKNKKNISFENYNKKFMDKESEI